MSAKSTDGPRRAPGHLRMPAPVYDPGVGINIFKPAGERRIETATWGLLLIWAGVVITVDLRSGVPAAVAGGIMLVSALLQKARGFEAGLVLWAGSLAFLLSGLNDLIGRDRHIPAFAVVLVVVGVLLLARALAPRKKRNQGFPRRTTP